MKNKWFMSIRRWIQSHTCNHVQGVPIRQYKQMVSDSLGTSYWIENCEDSICSKCNSVVAWSEKWSGWTGDEHVMKQLGIPQVIWKPIGLVGKPKTIK